MSVHVLVPLIPRTLLLIVSHLRTSNPHPCFNTAVDIALWTSIFLHSISHCQRSQLKNSCVYVITKNVHFVVSPREWQLFSRSFKCLDTQCHGPILRIYLNINQLDALNFIMSLFHASTCFEHMRSSSGGQNCTIQPLVSSHWNKWVV